MRWPGQISTQTEARSAVVAVDRQIAVIVDEVVTDLDGRRDAGGGSVGAGRSWQSTRRLPLLSIPSPQISAGGVMIWNVGVDALTTAGGIRVVERRASSRG